MLIGAGAGLASWLITLAAARLLPHTIAFYGSALAFAFGPGAVALTPLARHLRGAERIALACAFGIVLAPALISILLVLRAGFLFPPIAFAAAGIALVWWHERPALPALPAERLWYILLPLLVAAASLWVNGGRLSTTGDQTSIYGDYDTLDLTYYAAIAAEINHTTAFPPASPFYSGHRIIYSYYPLTFLGAVQRFTGVPMLETFLWLGWPFFGGVAAAALFAFARRLGSVPFAVTTTVLVFSGASLAYIAAWIEPSMVSLDPLIWSSMFLAPSAEWLFFNPWAPSLAVTSLGLYAVTRLSGEGSAVWMAVAAFAFGSLFMFKSFAFVVVVPALAIATTVWLVRRVPQWWRLAIVTAGTGLVALPWLLVILPYNRQENRGAVIGFERLWLVRRMLFKTDLTEPLADWVSRHVGADPHQWILLTFATLFFLLGSLGLRWLGVVHLLRGAVATASFRMWTPLAWVVLLGIAIPFFVTFAPFPNQIQPHMFAMFAFWPFAARLLWSPSAPFSWGRGLASLAVILLSMPATVHYASVTHRASSGTPLDTYGPADSEIIRTLRPLSSTTTMLLQSNPVWPSIYTIESGRHVALGWSSYVSGDFSPEVEALTARIAAFFGAPDRPGSEDLSLLKEQRVTHIIERTTRDRLHPNVVTQLQLVVGGPDVRLYRVPANLRR